MASKTGARRRMNLVKILIIIPFLGIAIMISATRVMMSPEPKSNELEPNPAAGELVWSQNVRVNDDQTDVEQRQADIAVDNLGNAYAVWFDDRVELSYWDLFFSYRPSEGNWSTNEAVTEPFAAKPWYPSIAVGQDGIVHLAWDDALSFPLKYAYRDQTGSWSEPVSVGSSGGQQPDIAVDQEGNAYLVWQDIQSGENVYFAYRPVGGIWELESKINDGLITTVNMCPSIAVDLTGDVHVAWATDNPVSGWDAYYAYKPFGGSWQGKVIINDQPGTVENCPDIALDYFGNAYALWGDGREGINRIYFSYHSRGGTWGTNTPVANFGSSWQGGPDLAVDSCGNAYAVWSEGSVNSDVYSAFRPSHGDWGPLVQINDDSTDIQYQAAISVDSLGNRYAVWSDKRNLIDYDIYFSVSDNPNNDADCDGLLDSWETYGLTQVVDGVTYYLDLPAMGADPQRKDIFVEIDYMVEQGICLPWIECMFGHSHQPKPEAVTKVIEAFANAPVPNPDGSTGIILHVDHGPESVMNPLTGEKWGDLSRSDPLPPDDWLGSMNGNEYNWSDFDTIKAENLSSARAPVFHYSVFAHYAAYKEDGLVRLPYSGISRGIPASDFIVSLADWPVSGGVGTVNEQAGTFMHELGHNLGLRHGGDDHTSYEPNFLSVMNYSFQTRGLMVNGQEGYFDYSRFTLPTLDENNLNETVGLDGGIVITNYGTRYYCATGGDRVVNSANEPIDWNCNDNSTETNVQIDVNKDISMGTLGSYNDWAQLVYTGGVVGVSGPAPGLPATTAVQEITRDEDTELTTIYKVGVTVPGNLAVLAGSTVEYSFILSNLGDNQDIYTLVSYSTQGWADTSSVPMSITLSEGASAEFLVTVNIPDSAGSGEKDELVFSAVSQSSPGIEDRAIAVSSVIYQLFLPTVIRDN